MMQTDPDVVVVGAGAAGVFGALTIRAHNPNSRVLLLERSQTPLGKVKISGGGRCNVTHHCFDIPTLCDYYPRGAKALKSVFSRFSPQDTITWFEQRGVQLKTEADGRMFPVTDLSQTIIDCFLGELQKANITLLTQAPVDTVTYHNQQCQVRIRYRQQTQHFAPKAILLATGGAPAVYEWLKALDHDIVDPVGSLFTFNIKSPMLEGLSGISFPNVHAVLETTGNKPIKQQGPLLITHWGLSGPVVLRLSAWGARALHATQYQGTVKVDFLPDYSFPHAEHTLDNDLENQAKRHIANVNPFGLPQRFWERLLLRGDISPELLAHQVNRKQRQWIVEQLKRMPLPITGKGVFKDEFVTAGGVALNQVDMQTMQSKKMPGLYFAGEVLDIDGLTGGFNFQSAWSTAYIAGCAIAEHI